MIRRAGALPMNAKQLAGPVRRAELFEELLRDIGVVDRAQHAALAQALEGAFVAGAVLVQADPHFRPQHADGQPGVVEFADLPHDAQDGFQLLTELAGLDYPGDHPTRSPSPVVLRSFHTADGKRSWWAELPKHAPNARWSSWVILTLERFGMVCALPNNPGRATLTHRAIALMQTGRASLDIPAAPAWERNPRVRDVAVQDRREPAAA